MHSFSFDKNGNLVSRRDPLNQVSRYGYDLMDRRNKVTRPLGGEATRHFNSRGLVSKVVDGNGLSKDLGYDARGWLNRATLGGQAWELGHDQEGRIVSIRQPSGRQAIIERDKLGRMTKYTDGASHSMTISRDALGRTTKITDGLGQEQNFSYDARGLLTGATLPNGQGAAYAYDHAGWLKELTDLKEKPWGFTRTAIGRMKSHTDPLNNVWQYSYDENGRLRQTAFPDGTTLTRNYDKAGNMTGMSHSGGFASSYTFDGMNRLLTADSFSLARDAEGRIIGTVNPGTSFGASYDEGGRLVAATYNNGAFKVQYTYDGTTGLLSQVSNTLTNATVSFTHDQDRRLTGVTRSNGVNAAHTHDQAGRLTRLQDGSLIDMNYQLDGAGQVTTAEGREPLMADSGLTAVRDNFEYDDASRLKGAYFSYDKRGRMVTGPSVNFTWNGANLATAIGSASLTYNGLGDPVTRTQRGVTVHYYYNRAIASAPMVAEKSEGTGQFLRYYVWTPGGELLYMIDAENGNALRFFHFSREGHTLALTDKDGQVTDRYAYTPYGLRTVSAQPFTFQGRWGTRQEGTTGRLYQAKARYYDAQAGRFVSREPLWPSLSDPLQLNPYQYARMNPLKYHDLTGLEVARIPDSLKSPELSETSVGYKADLEHRLRLNMPIQPSDDVRTEFQADFHDGRWGYNSNENLIVIDGTIVNNRLGAEYVRDDSIDNITVAPVSQPEYGRSTAGMVNVVTRSGGNGLPLGGGDNGLDVGGRGEEFQQMYAPSRGPAASPGRRRPDSLTASEAVHMGLNQVPKKMSFRALQRLFRSTLAGALQDPAAPGSMDDSLAGKAWMQIYSQWRPRETHAPHAPEEIQPVLWTNAGVFQFGVRVNF